MKIIIMFTLLLYMLRENSGYSIPKLEDRNSSDIYEVQEGNVTALKIINPKPGKQTLREIVYYHIIERPYEESREGLKFREAEGSGPEYDETTRPFTNGHGFPFVEPKPSQVAEESGEVKVEAVTKEAPPSDNDADGSKEIVEEETPVEEEFPEDKTGLESGEDVLDDAKGYEYDESTELPEELDVMSERKAAREHLFNNSRKRYKKAITASLRRHKRDIPAPPTLPPLNYDALPEYVRALISTEKPRTRPVLDPKREEASNFGTEMATRRINLQQGEPKSTRTYGMSLRNDRGRVWNDLWNKANAIENDKYENPDVIERPDVTEANVYLSKSFKETGHNEETTTESKHNEREEEKVDKERYQAKSTIENRLKDIFATLKPFEEKEDKPKKLRTYGMKMTNGEARVWNNLWSDPGSSIGFSGIATDNKKEGSVPEKPETPHKEEKESEYIDPENKPYKDMSENLKPSYNIHVPNTHENYDIFAKVNKNEEHTTSSPIEKITILPDEKPQGVPNHQIYIQDIDDFNKATSKSYESMDHENLKHHVTSEYPEVEFNVETTTETKEDARSNAKSVIEHRIENILATLNPFVNKEEDKPKKSRTYGMSITNGEAHVWNNLWNNPGSSIDFGGIETENKKEEYITEKPEIADEKEKDSEKELEIKPNENMNTGLTPDDDYDIFVNVNKKEKPTTPSVVETTTITYQPEEPETERNKKLNIQDRNDFYNKATTKPHESSNYDNLNLKDHTTIEPPKVELDKENDKVRPKNAIDQRKQDMIAGIKEFREEDGEYYKKPRTYGMVLTGDHGHVWNNIFTDPEVSFDVGEPDYNIEEYKENTVTTSTTTLRPHINESKDETPTPIIPEEDSNKEQTTEKQEKNQTEKPEVKPNEETGSVNALPDNKDEKDESKAPEENIAHDEKVECDNDKNKQEVEKKPDTFEDLMNNEEFWKWLADWTSAYTELLTKHISKTVKEEVEKQTKELFEDYIKKLNEAKLEPSKDNEDTSTTDPKEPIINDNKLIIDGKEIPITNTSNIDEKDKGNKDDELLKKRKDKDSHTRPTNQSETNTICKNDEKSTPINIKNEDIHGNTIGNITNIYIFYPNKDVNEIIKDLNQTNGNINISGNGSIDVVVENHNLESKKEETEKPEATTTAPLIPDVTTVVTTTEVIPVTPTTTKTPQVTSTTTEVASTTSAVTSTPELTSASSGVTPTTPEVTSTTSEVTLTPANPEVALSTTEVTAPETTPNTIEVTPSIPEVTSASPEATSTTSEVTLAGPEVTSNTPEITSAGPEVTSNTPEITSEDPEVTSTHPELTSASPEENATAEVTSASPEVTSAIPEVSAAAPEVTSTTSETAPVTLEVTSDIPAPGSNR